MLRALSRVLAPDLKVRSSADLGQIRGQLRLFGLFALTILLPGLLLAAVGVGSIQGEELALWDEVGRRAELAADTVILQTELSFSSFEDNTRQRLESGRSPVDALGELSPYLLVAFRVDESGRVAAPFNRQRGDAVRDHSLLLSEAWREAAELEQHSPLEGAAAFHDIEGEARGLQAKGMARFAEARALIRAGRRPLAEQLLADVVADYGAVRDLYGFRLGDLARLRRGELLLDREPEIGAGSLIALVEELLGDRWTIGVGGEPAVAARALELLEDTAPKDWLASARGRLDEKARLLYWASQVEDDLDLITAGGLALRVAPASFSYQATHKTLWATAWWSEDLYAFALDGNAVLEHIDQLAQQSVKVDAELSAIVVAPEGSLPPKVLARRTLAPWLPGWSLAMVPSDPEDLTRRQLSLRLQRVVIIALSVLMILMGGFLTVRLVNRQLETAREKTDFAANVSHELRSPITQIRLKGEALQFGLVFDEEDLQKHYDAIVRESERLSRLVDNVLDFASIEQGAKSYVFRPVDIGETVRAAVEAARYSMETRGMVMDIDLPPFMPVVMHDPEAIGQVMQNLISNAAKYGKEGGWIGVKGRIMPEGVEIMVSDRGIGIPPDEVDQIFERFYRSKDPDARRKKGTGIGLTIVRYIVEAHNGNIRVNSTLGQGTTFTIHFPLRPPGPTT
ncbi:MAG: HAMP domain-containing histidine kinase [Alphaproteobacteria bacterium]|nr:HAMP domain-containing histidine kinase [Alphaproteobacteria bacterium]MCB9794443.1 HAMP domain-containing histidine kinase [Alphaproteobacteria bacterium]